MTKLNCSLIISKKKDYFYIRFLYLISLKIPAKNTNYFAALHFSIYSALAVKVAIVVCLLLNQLIGLFYNKKTYAEVEQ